MNKKKRKTYNDSIIARLKRGEPLNTVPPEATWWPPRPTIKKDPEAVKKLYGVDASTLNDKQLKVVADKEDGSETSEV